MILLTSKDDHSCSSISSGVPLVIYSFVRHYILRKFFKFHGQVESSPKKMQPACI